MSSPYGLNSFLFISLTKQSATDKRESKELTAYAAVSFCFINKALQERLDQKLGFGLPGFGQYKTTPWKRGHVF
jgi:hypothetical protein